MYSLPDLLDLRRSVKLRIEAEIRTGDLTLAAEAIEELAELDRKIEEIKQHERNAT